MKDVFVFVSPLSEEERRRQEAALGIRPHLRFDGLYINSSDGVSRYLMFTSNGDVHEVSSTGTPEQVIRWLAEKGNKGTYTLEPGQVIRFTSVSSSGAVEYQGRLEGDSLLLDIHSHINGYRASGVRYSFVPMKDGKQVRSIEQDKRNTNEMTDIQKKPDKGWFSFLRKR